MTEGGNKNPLFFLNQSRARVGRRSSVVGRRSSVVGRRRHRPPALRRLLRQCLRRRGEPPANGLRFLIAAPQRKRAAPTCMPWRTADLDAPRGVNLLGLELRAFVHFRNKMSAEGVNGPTCFHNVGAEVGRKPYIAFVPSHITEPDKITPTCHSVPGVRLAQEALEPRHRARRRLCFDFYESLCQHCLGPRARHPE